MKEVKNTLRTLVINGEVSLTLANTSEIVKTAAKLHKLSPSSTVLLGKALSAMTFASACLKEEKGERRNRTKKKRRWRKMKYIIVIPNLIQP